MKEGKHFYKKIGAPGFAEDLQQTYEEIKNNGIEIDPPRTTGSRGRFLKPDKAKEEDIALFPDN